MKISNFDFGTFIFVIIIIAVVGGLGTLIALPLYNEHKFETKFPIGSSVQLKSLDIKGNVSKYVAGEGITEQDVELLIIDKNGQAQKIRANANLLTK